MMEPVFPQEIVEQIIDHVADIGNSTKSLISCSLVSRSWTSTAQKHIFAELTLMRLVKHVDDCGSPPRDTYLLDPYIHTPSVSWEPLQENNSVFQISATLASYVKTVHSISNDDRKDITSLNRSVSRFFPYLDSFAKIIDLIPSVQCMSLIIKMDGSREDAIFYDSVLRLFHRSNLSRLELVHVSLNDLQFSTLIYANKALKELGMGSIIQFPTAVSWTTAGDETIALQRLDMADFVQETADKAIRWLIQSRNPRMLLTKIEHLSCALGDSISSIGTTGELVRRTRTSIKSILIKVFRYSDLRNFTTLDVTFCHLELLILVLDNLHGVEVAQTLDWLKGLVTAEEMRPFAARRIPIRRIILKMQSLSFNPIETIERSSWQAVDVALSRSEPIHVHVVFHSVNNVYVGFRGEGIKMLRRRFKHIIDADRAREESYLQRPVWTLKVLEWKDYRIYEEKYRV